MNVLVAHLTGRAPTGGMSRLLGLSHELLAQKGHRIDFLTSDDVGEWERGAAGRVLFPLTVFRRVRFAARRGTPYDVVNVHEQRGAVITVLKQWAGNPAVVVTTHGVEQRGWEVLQRYLESRGEPASIKTRLVYPLTSLSQSRISLHWADHVVALNDDDARYLQRQFHVPCGRITVVRPGANPIYGQSAAARQYRPIRRVLFAGTWTRRKGIIDLVAAFTHLRSSGREIDLIVLGAGASSADVLAAFDPRIRPNVHVVAASSDGDAASIMAEADAFVLPSAFEGTPLTLIEAMWSGLPIVTTATAGMKDVIRHGETGLLVEVGDVGALVEAVERLLDEPPLAERLGRSAREAARQFTWQVCAEGFERAYERAMRVTAG